MRTESLLQYLDGYLGTTDHPDYPSALNGLQVEGSPEVSTVATAVDASLASIEAAARLGADLLIVHHGLFWRGLRPVVGRLHRRLTSLLDAEVALYSCHLPLDSHAEVGNCALLARSLGLELEGRLGAYEGADIGWWGRLPRAMTADGLSNALADAVGRDVHAIAAGPDRIETVGVVTGGGGSFIPEAAGMGLDAFVTGEGAHHNYFDATECGIHVLFGGHYATEVFGVRALGEHVTERFGIASHFIDQPTGL